MLLKPGFLYFSTWLSDTSEVKQSISHVIFRGYYEQIIKIAKDPSVRFQNN